MASLELCYFEQNVLQTPKMIAVKILKSIIGWKKYILLTLWRMPSRLQTFLLSANFELDSMMLHKHSLAAKFSQILGFFIDKFLQDSRHFRGWNFGEWKTQCLLAIGGDKKVSFLECPPLMGQSWIEVVVWEVFILVLHAELFPQVIFVLNNDLGTKSGGNSSSSDSDSDDGKYLIQHH